MGGYLSKRPRKRFTSELKSLHADLQTNIVITDLDSGLEVRAVSFNSLSEITECLLDMKQQVVKVILDSKKDLWKKQELFELVEEYFENCLNMLEFCTSLEKCLKSARHSQLLIHTAVQQFQEEDNVEGNKYSKTLEKLKNLKDAGDPFKDDFVQIFDSVYKHQIVMLERLQSRKNKLDKKLKKIHAWRKVSAVIFAATSAAVLICSVVAAAMATPPVAAALAAATSIPLGSLGKRIDSLLNNFENAVRGQKEVNNSMNVGAYITITDLDNIRILIHKLEIDIEPLLKDADFAINEGAVKVAVEDINERLAAFMNNIEKLEVQADKCSQNILRARTVILQRIIKHPNH